jgi:uncharacterized protein
MAELSLAEQQRLVAALRASLRARQPGLEVGLIETHISFVLLAGALAYKIKKAVNLGFLDFTTLAQRRFYGEEELRLNRRIAPSLYLELLPVTGSVEQPVLGGAGPPLDWALKMRAFAQDDLWDRLATRGALRPAHIDALAEALVAFHREAAVAGADDSWSQPAAVRAPVRDSLQALDTLCRAPAERAQLAALNAWEATAFDALQAVFAQRLAGGHVRECHGDLHLGNVTQYEGRTTMFDGLEFSAALRWTDVMSDLAFMAMDLQAHALPRLAHRFVNAYVEGSGDVAGLRVLRYHGVYRALVRAKIAALRRDQIAPGAARAAAAATADRYLDIASAFSRPASPALILTHGCSGSGKTLATHSLLELGGAIRLRADVERKRLFGLPALARSDAAAKAQLYASAANEATQARLREAATLALASGFPVILDATFLARRHRDEARALAQQLGVGFVIVDFQARIQTLRQRVAARARQGGDASEADLAVLEAQLAQAEPLGADEQDAVFAFDAEPALDEAALPARWAPLLRVPAIGTSAWGKPA